MVYGKNKYLWKGKNTLWENSKIYENLSIGEFMVDVRWKTLNYQTILYKLYRNKCWKGTLTLTEFKMQGQNLY